MNDYEKNQKTNEEAPVSWCVIPWTSIQINGNGVYRLCCNAVSKKTRARLALKNSEGRDMHIKQNSFSDAMNSPVMKSVRLQMLKSKWPEECARCESEFKSGTKSMNIKVRSSLAHSVESDHYPSYLKAKALTERDGSISLKDFPISFADIRFGNYCNLKCIMCGPTESNKWYRDYILITGKKYFKEGEERIKLKSDSRGQLKTEKNVFEWSNNPFFLSQIEKHIAYFRKVHITGGEPLIIKAHYEFLKKCIQRQVASKIHLEYNSNITIIPQLAWKLWEHFKVVEMSLSVDGFGRINDFIRYPCKWQQIEKNLKKFDTAQGNFSLHIVTVISVLNIWHLPEFIWYIMHKNYQRIGSYGDVISPHPLHQPEWLNISILPDLFKEMLKKRFAKYKHRILEFNWQAACGNSKQTSNSWDMKTKKACEVLDSYIKFMDTKQFNSKQLSEYRGAFIYFMDKLDEVRGTCWQEILPELYEHTYEWRKLFSAYISPAQLWP